jgi:hypothetical protein
MSWTLHDNTLKEYFNDVFVETGTCEGAAIDLALISGFKEIYSIEIMEPRHLAVKEKFKDNQNVNLFHGSSSELLLEMCQKISPDKRITFWLDGHCGDVESENCPLIKELEQIKKLPRNDHTILIDDVRCFGNILSQTKEEVESAVLAINEKYQIKYIDSKYAGADILVATV